MRHLSDIILDQTPLQLSTTASVREACTKMHERAVGSVLVTGDDGSLVGIFTARDAVHRVVAAGKDADATGLGDVMTPDPTTMTPASSAIEALRLMWDGGFRHVPVIDRGVVRGVVSRGDFEASENERLEYERDLAEHMR